MASLIDVNKWRGAINGMFTVSLMEREKYWSYSDDVDFEIACKIKNLLDLYKLKSIF